MTASAKSPPPQQSTTSTRPDKSASSPQSASEGPWRPPMPFKRHTRLFVALMVILAIWCVIMVVMYFRLVRPLEREPADRPKQSAVVSLQR
jgi:hypothetical protein